MLVTIQIFLEEPIILSPHSGADRAINSLDRGGYRPREQEF